MSQSTNTPDSVGNKRLWEIDMLRGVAVVMMITYHILWDLTNLGNFSVNIYEGFWHYFQVSTASLFVTIAGISVVVSYQSSIRNNQPGWKRILAHGSKILGYGIIISFITYFMNPETYIQFGILHLIGFSILVSYPLIEFKWLNLFLGVALIVARQVVLLADLRIEWLNWFGLSSVLHPTLDYFPVLPWLGMALIGIFIGNTLYQNATRQFALKIDSDFFIIKTLRTLGAHSLVIYFIHQPVLIVLLALTGMIHWQLLLY